MSTSVPSARHERRRHDAAELFERVAQAERAGDTAASSRLRDEAVLLHLDIARDVAARFRNRGVEEEDLAQVARLALVRAARGFDPDRGTDFVSYALPSMRGEVRKYFRDRGWMVRPPRRVQELQAMIFPARAELEQELGRVPRATELARRLDLRVVDVVDALAADGCFHPSSLDRPVGEEGDQSLGDRLVAEDGLGELGRSEATLLLGPLVSSLSERDRLVLRRRFYDDWTQRRIGEELEVTQMQVSRILSRILGDLRRRLDEPASATG